ncbi:hypothetical protein M8C21_011366, partial [Ambrosia artemisiifolia]
KNPLPSLLLLLHSTVVPAPIPTVGVYIPYCRRLLYPLVKFFTGQLLDFCANMGKSSKKMKKLQQKDIHSSSSSDDDIINQPIQNVDGDDGSDNEEEYDSELDNINMDSGEDVFGNDTVGEDESDSDEQDDGEDEDDGMGMKIEDNNNADMEELEKEYKDLQNKEQDLFRNIRHDQEDDFLKGQAVKNQRGLWDKTLEFRFLLQKSFSTANRLPQEPIRSAFCNSGEEVKEAYSDLINSTKKTLDSILKLQETLVENNPSIMDATEEGDAGQYSKSLNSTEGDDEWFQISQMQSRITPFRNMSVDKWQRKTQLTSGAAGMKNKFQAFNQNISEQVASYMRDPSRMMKGMQQSRSAVPVFGDVSDSTLNKDEPINADGDPELLDDSEYHIHEKIVNFMAPEPMNIPPMAPKLFENLFGLKTLKPASSVS